MGALLSLSACAPDSEPADTTAGEPTQSQAEPSGTKAERAAAAGLSDEDVAYLDSTGIAVYLPVVPDGWRLEDTFTERDDANKAFVPFYSVTYRTPDSTCVSISGTSQPREEWTTAPPHERTVAVPGVPTPGAVRLGWGTAEENASGWEGGMVATEGFGTNGITYVVGSSNDDGCQVATPEDVERLVATLRALDPAGDALLN